MRMSPSITCESPFNAWFQGKSLHSCRRTYSDEDEGEDIRHGFDPSRIPPAGASEFAVGDEDEDEDEEDEAGHEEPRHQSDEARTWSQEEHGIRPTGAGKYREDLDDRHIWDSKDTHEED